MLEIWEKVPLGLPAWLRLCATPVKVETADHFRLSRLLKFYAPRFYRNNNLVSMYASCTVDRIMSNLIQCHRLCEC